MDSVNINPYAYLDKDQFTSELYKIEIRNLFNKVGFSQLKQRLQTLDLKPHKVKILPELTYVTFKCEADRDLALTKVNGHTWKGRILVAKIAKGRADPFLMKRKGDQIDEEEQTCAKVVKIEDDDRTEEEKLKDHVLKFWRKPYPEQLVEKEKKITGVLKNMYSKINKLNPIVATSINYFSKSVDNNLICAMEPIKASPIVDNYRNKCEFTIGMTLDGNGPIAGFCHGKYRGGIDAVGDSRCLPIIPEKMTVVLNHINKILPILVSDEFQPKLAVHRPGSNAGHLRGVTLRAGGYNMTEESIGDTESLLMILDLHPHELSEEELTKIGDYLREYFVNGAGEECRLTSIMVTIRRTNGEPVDLTTTRAIYGPGHVYEKLNNLIFRVSFNAFFQVNTLAAEILYGTIREVLKEKILVNTSGDVTLLDVCCGTGTIGLAMADLVDRVVGLEMCAEAIHDAGINATLNKIENVTFHVGKAEDTLGKLLANEDKEVKSIEREYVAIVDPPRAGLHPSVIQALRRCTKIKKIIFVSCDPEAAQSNLLDFVRPISKRTFGCPFIPELAVPVDLFPHTNHVELVMLLTRLGK